jgi:hypothetical protein
MKWDKYTISIVAMLFVIIFIVVFVNLVIGNSSAARERKAFVDAHRLPYTLTSAAYGLAITSSVDKTGMRQAIPQGAAQCSGTSQLITSCCILSPGATLSLVQVIADDTGEAIYQVANNNTQMEGACPFENFFTVHHKSSVIEAVRDDMHRNEQASVIAKALAHLN